MKKTGLHKKDNKNIIFTITLIVIIIFILIIVLLFKLVLTSPNYSVLADTRYKSFEDCLNAQDITIYINSNSPQIELRKITLIETLNNFKIKNCLRDPDYCRDKNIKKFPTWIINSNKIENEINQEDLVKYTGCK
jgi:hypothetical protein